MKKILILIFAIALFGCQNEVKPNYIVISGTITNKQPGDLTIQTFDNKFKETLEVSEEGNFVDTLNVNSNSYVLYDGKNPVFMYLEPGDKVDIKYDVKDFENSIQITGKGSEATNYLFSKINIEKTRFGSPQKTFTLNELDFKAKLKSIMNAQDSLLNTIKNISEKFISNEKKNLYYTYINRLKSYEPAYKHFTKNNDFTVSNDFLSEIKTLDFNNEEDYIFSNDYKKLVKDYYTDESKKILKNENLSKGIAFLKTVSKIESPIIKNGLLFDYTFFNLGYVKNKEEFYNLFLENSTDEENNIKITEKYKKFTALKKGNPSPKFIDYKNHAGGKVSLDDLKGKYVYIDVWATWCGPCIKQIPHLQKIEKQYHDKNIEFVSISIDKQSDYEKWETMVKEQNLGGIQLFADKNWNSAFVQAYNIQGIPKFILIDTAGNIVEANAPRPSSPKLIELFNEYNL